MKKILIWFFLSAFSVLAQAEIQIQVEPSQVTLGHAFQLSLTLGDPQNGGVPDLAPLQKDFVILSTERTMNYTVINGQAQSTSQWIISLRAKKSGILTIPVIKIGTEHSNSMTINVDGGTVPKDSQPDTSQTQDVMLKVEVNEQKPYVNQQIVYTVKLYNSKRLLDVSYHGPQVQDALVIPLEEKRSQVILNNTNYMVEEQSYAIFPQKSGTLKIISPTFSALVYDLDPQRIKVQDKIVNLTVQPIPKQYTGTMWFPAKNLKLTERYENANQTISQGSTLIRTVTLFGVAIPAQLLPTPTFTDNDAFKVYPEKGADKTRVVQGELVGSTEFKVTYLFNKAGKVTIPELRVPWFNTETGKQEFAVLAPRSMDITPSTSATTPNAAPQVTPPKESSLTPAVLEVKSSAPTYNTWAWIMAIVFAVAWLITLALWGWQRRSRQLGKGQYKQALEELNRACIACNPQQARNAILTWASLHWPDAPVLNLSDVESLVRDVRLKKQLHLLSQVLYKSDAKALWRGDELLRAVRSIQRSKVTIKRKRALPPINP